LGIIARNRVTGSQWVFEGKGHNHVECSVRLSGRDALDMSFAMVSAVRSVCPLNA